MRSGKHLNLRELAASLGFSEARHQAAQ
jgi:hypothetical protein